MDTSPSHKDSPNGTSSFERNNFSTCGKMCDQTFYQSGTIHRSLPVVHDPPEKMPKPRKHSSFIFSSVSREKRGNFRTPVQIADGEFNYHPNPFVGRNKSPEYSMPRSKFNVDKIKNEYKLCYKHPIATKKLLSIQESEMDADTMMDEKSKLLKSISG